MARLKGIDKHARCPVCGGTQFMDVPVGRAEVWNQQVDKYPQWKRFRGLAERAAVAFHEPRLEWDQPTFEPSNAATGHVRCGTCASLVPPQFLAAPKSRVLLITAGMPEAGKTTWLKCLFNPAQKRYLIAEPTQEISRDPYRFVEPYTIANPDPRTAVPFLLHGMHLKFQRNDMDVAGIDIKGEVFHQRTTTPDKYLRVLDILANLRAMRFADLFVTFVVPFDATCKRQNIGQLGAHLMHEPGSRGRWQGVLWTHLDYAQLHDQAALFEFLSGTDAALALAKRAVAKEELFTPDFGEAAAQIQRVVQGRRNWADDLPLLESLTWLLYRLMLSYSDLPARFGRGNVEFYFSFSGGLGSILVRHCMGIAAALFAAWDRAGCGDFAAMIRESMMPRTELLFPVLPCGLEMLSDDDEGLPVWGDLLLLEILRRHV